MSCTDSCNLPTVFCLRQLGGLKAHYSKVSKKAAVILGKDLLIDDDTNDVEILADVFKSTGVESMHQVYTTLQALGYLEEVNNKTEK